MALAVHRKKQSSGKRRPANKKKPQSRPATVKKTRRKKTAAAGKKGTRKQNLSTYLAAAPKAPFPKTIQPMLATLVNKPFDETGWLYEIKWDGYRTLALLNNGRVELKSRNNKSFNEKFYPVHHALREWNIHAIVDGEITVLDDKGVSHFSSLQEWRSEADGELLYYVFDMLWLNGYDLKALPLVKRRELLKANLPPEGTIRMSESFDTSATEFMEAAAGLGMEGIIAKKADSRYYPGERTREWLKIKNQQRQEVVIGGYTRNEGSGKTFSSLLAGVYNKGKLEYTGKIGTGFTNRLQKELMTMMEPLVTSKAPFAVIPDVNKPSRFRPNPPKAAVTWLKPRLVCEVSYAEMTADGVMRHPSFEGLREDKKPKEVVREKPVSTNEIVKEKTRNKKDTGARTYVKPVVSKGRKTLLNPKDKTQVRKINGHELKFTNLHKIYWPKEKYTKRDMLNYYYQAAPVILPYLKDRPQTLNRYPNGISGKSFYQKDVTGKAPAWVKVFPYHTSTGEDKNFLVPEDEASILYMANLGAIELNPWNSTIHKPGYPDWCLIDLDPAPANSFEQVILAAQVTKQVLDDFGITGYPKTSGSTGIHIYIPLGAKYTYDECQLFGKLVATQVHHELPDFTSIERMTRKRKGKLYVDYLQNRPKATLAAPYSLRPKPGAPVSMPLHWEEVKKGLSIRDFTIANAMNRIKNEGDIFRPVLGKGINISKIIRKSYV